MISTSLPKIQIKLAVLLTIKIHPLISIRPIGYFLPTISRRGFPLSTKKNKYPATLRRLDVVMAAYNGNVALAVSAANAPDPKLRISALLVLHKLDRLIPEMLGVALTDSEPSVRRYACELAASYPGVSLSSALEDSDPFVVEMALWALGEREDETGTAKICAIAANHPESLVREAAVACLGAIGDENGLETILGALNDKPNVRRRAVIALSAFEGEQVTEALRSATSDRDWQTRQIAEDLLEITEGSSE